MFSLCHLHLPSIRGHLVLSSAKLISPSLHEEDLKYNELGLARAEEVKQKARQRPFWGRKWLPIDLLRLGNPIDWVSTHRYHHKFTDSSKDPHSPVEGFWFSHMYWVLDRYYLTQKCGVSNNVGDLRKQLFYRFVEKTYYIHALAPMPFLYAAGGFPFVFWGMGVRTVAFLHATFLVNSACHFWGKQAWNTGDLSRNNWWVAILTFGEGWHNNHHAFETSARQGLELWQIDMTWGVIRMLEAAGLATDVKLPTEGQKKRMAAF